MSLLVVLQSFFAVAQKVSNITYRQEESNIIVFYDLETKTSCKIDLYVSINGGTSWQGPLIKVIGDVGAKVNTGKRSITWNVLEEFNELSGSNIKFQIRAEEPKNQSITAINNAILKNPKEAKLYKLRGDLKFEISNSEDGKYSEEDARADYKKAILLNPKYADAYKALGNLERGLSAISYYDKAISINPKDAETYYLRSESNYYTNKEEGKVYLERSLKDINTAVELNSNNITYLLLKGELKKELKDKSCIDDFDKILKLDSLNHKALRLRGAAKFEFFNDVEGTKLDFNNFFNLKNVKSNFDDVFGNILYPSYFYFDEMKDYSLALEYSNKVIEASSKFNNGLKDSINYIFQDALLCRAISKNRLNDFVGFENDLNTLIENSKYSRNNKYLINKICQFFKSREFDKDFVFLLGLITKKILAKPWETEYYLMRAEIYESLEKYSAAILDINQVLKSEPNKENYKRRAKLKIDIKDYKGAISDYSYAIELNNNSNNSDLFHNRAVAKDELKDYSGAIADYSKAILLDPKDADNYIARANSKSNIKDYIGAIADINKALEINPTLDYLYFRRANNKFNLGDYRGAISDYSKYIIKNPQDAESYYNRGDAKYNINDFKGAIADYTKTISLDPKYAEAYLWRGNAKIEIKDKIGACKDFSKAGELELKEAYDAINKNCN